MTEPTNNIELRMHPDHLADLRKSGLLDEIISKAGIESVMPHDIDKGIGFPTFAKSAYKIQYSKNYSRFKMFYAEADKINPKTGEERPKYLVPKGSLNRLYVPPMFDKSIFEDAKRPLHITEGEKKTLKANQEGIDCIGISGLWNFTQKDKSLIPDFDTIDFRGRTVYINPDNDWRNINKNGTPKNLSIAVYRLADALILRGAIVFVVNLPKSEQKIGLDDYLITHKKSDFDQLVAAAEHVLPLDERIDIATSENYTDLLHSISDVLPLSKREGYVKRLAQIVGIRFYTLQREVNGADTTVKGIIDATNADAATQVQKLIEIAEQFILFHDDVKEGYASVNNVAVKIRSNQFKHILAKALWDFNRKSPNNDTLGQALNVIEAKAVFEGDCRRLFNRIAEYEGAFFYDLCDGRVVRITTDNWNVVNDFPILFKKYSHQQPQVSPQKGGDIKSLFRFINIKSEKYRLLTQVYLISCFVPGIPHPIFHPYGDQGSGKTSMFTTFKQLVDPSKLDVLITPKNPEELVQILEHHYLCTFDNLSACQEWLSDLLCQACTGAGFSKRKLYSDDDDIIYQIQRCIGINGINLIVARADLMDRTILLPMERIEPSERKEKRVILQKFKEERPYLLGCFFDTLQKAMAIYPTVKLDNLPRMADFARWGMAISRALGYADSDFISAYKGNIEAQNSEVINSNTLAQAVIGFMQNKERWDGTVKDAFEKLAEIVTVAKEDKTFPKLPNKLRGHLNRIKSNLLDYGIRFQITDYDTKHKGCPMFFQKVPKGYSLSSSIPQTNKNAGLTSDDSFGIIKHPEGIPKVSRKPDASKIKDSGVSSGIVGINEHKIQTLSGEHEYIPDDEIFEVEKLEEVSK